jgi:hypothetical protein
VRSFRLTRLSTLVAVGALSLPPLANTASAVVATPRETPAIATQSTELKGSSTVANDYFGRSVAISGTTAVVGAYGHDRAAG